MHVRPPRKIDSCSRRHNNGSKLESSADLLFLPRICYSCPDLLFLHRFAQICYSWQNLLFPQSASVKWFQHKGASLPRSKTAEPSSQLLKLFNIFRFILNSTPSIQREQQPSQLGFHQKELSQAERLHLMTLCGLSPLAGWQWWHPVHWWQIKGAVSPPDGRHQGHRGVTLLYNHLSYRHDSCNHHQRLNFSRYNITYMLQYI